MCWLVQCYSFGVLVVGMRVVGGEATWATLDCGTQDGVIQIGK